MILDLVQKLRLNPRNLVKKTLKKKSVLIGKLMIFCNKIGDYDDPHCSLYGSYLSFIEIIEIIQVINNLWIEGFSNLSDREIFNFLDEKLYGFHGDVEIIDSKTAEDCRIDQEKYSKFDFLNNWGEMFDKSGKSFLLKLPDGRLQVLLFDLDKNILKDYFCSEFSFRIAVKCFVTWFDEQAVSLK